MESSSTPLEDARVIPRDRVLPRMPTWSLYFQSIDELLSDLIRTIFSLGVHMFEGYSYDLYKMDPPTVSARPHHSRVTNPKTSQTGQQLSNFSNSGFNIIDSRFKAQTQTPTCQRFRRSTSIIISSHLSSPVSFLIPTSLRCTPKPLT